MKELSEKRLKPMQENGNAVRCPECREILSVKYSKCPGCGRNLDWNQVKK